MKVKPKVCISSLGACGGCDETFVDLDEYLLKVVDLADIVFWPTALDFKYHHLESIDDGGIALSIISGHVRNSEQEEIAKLIRRKSQIVLSFGSCACFGGTPGMANFRSREDILNWVYKDCPAAINPEGVYPQTESQVDGHKLTLPEFFDRVYALKQIIDVDYYLPGCPPPIDLVINCLEAVFSGKMPQKGSTLAPHKSVCDTCKRNQWKPTSITMQDLKRIHRVEANPNTCFLAQGVLCMGPATRGGCGEPCMNANMPCRGCFGPVEGVEDAGVKYLSALATLIKAENDKEMRRFVEETGDLAGYLYRFTLPVSALGKIQNSRSGSKNE